MQNIERESPDTVRDLTPDAGLSGIARRLTRRGTSRAHVQSVRRGHRMVLFMNLPTGVLNRSAVVTIARFCDCVS
jgi:hypothetical protein